jgi:hypothetical protein
MKKRLAFLAMALVIFSAGFVLAEGNERAEQEARSWELTGEMGMGIHSGYYDDTGEKTYKHPVSTQTVTVNYEKDGTGVYIQAENFIPFRNEESKETDFYVGFFTEAWEMKFDFGYAHYWAWERGSINYHALYGKIEFPEIFWGIVPFLKAEYRIANRSGLDDFGNPISMDGFWYQGGLKRHFELNKKLTLNTEVAVGGNTGIHGYKAENLAFVREKAELTYALDEQWKLKLMGMGQQGLGGKNGIAGGTDEWVVSFWIVYTF